MLWLYQPRLRPAVLSPPPVLVNQLGVEYMEASVVAHKFLVGSTLWDEGPGRGRAAERLGRGLQ